MYLCIIYNSLITRACVCEAKKNSCTRRHSPRSHFVRPACRSLARSLLLSHSRIKMSITKDRKSTDRRTIDVDGRDWSWFINGPPPLLRRPYLPPAGRGDYDLFIRLLFNACACVTHNHSVNFFFFHLRGGGHTMTTLLLFFILS